MPLHSFSSPATALKRGPNLPTPVRILKVAPNMVASNSANTDPNEHLDSAQFAILKDVVARTVIQLSTAHALDTPTPPVKRRKARGRRAAAEASQEEGGVGDEGDEGEEGLANDLEEFVLYLAEEVWAVLPEKDKSFPERKPTSTTAEDAPEKPEADSEGNEEEETSSSATPAFTESLLSYSLVASESSASETFHKIVIEYRQDLADSPPDEDFVDTGYELPGKGGWWATRKEECEICGRNCPLSYHHLIPRSTHVKVLRKKWHPPERLNVVAWLCR